MAKFQAPGIVIRDLESVRIIFKDKESVWVIPKGKGQPNVVFHRWWWKMGEYQRWFAFRHALYRNKHVNLATCYKLALRHDVAKLETYRQPKLNGKIIIRKEQS